MEHEVYLALLELKEENRFLYDVIKENTEWIKEEKGKDDVTNK